MVKKVSSNHLSNREKARYRTLDGWLGSSDPVIFRDDLSMADAVQLCGLDRSTGGTSSDEWTTQDTTITMQVAQSPDLSYITYQD